jgi:hypothetical protein
MTISLKTKQEIFKTVLLKEDPFGFSDFDNGLIPFLENIWDLKSMPSTDGRFNNAGSDIYQHMINNNDWDYEYLFIERLNFYNKKKLY